MNNEAVGRTLPNSYLRGVQLILATGETFFCPRHKPTEKLETALKFPVEIPKSVLIPTARQLEAFVLTSLRPYPARIPASKPSIRTLKLLRAFQSS